MASKRTRSATRQPQLESDSSDVTDYLGPYASKMQKRGNEALSPKAYTSARVTRSSVAPSVLPEDPKQQTATMHRQMRQEQVNADKDETDESEDEAQDEDDDGSVHVDHNHISSAINQARRGPQRTVNGLRADKDQLEYLRANSADEDESGQDQENEEDVEVNSTPKTPVGRRGRPSKSKPKQNEKFNLQGQPNTRPRADASAARNDTYQIPDTPARTLRPQRGTPTRNGVAEGQPTPQRHDRWRLQREESQPAAPVQDDEQGAETSSSEGEDSEEVEPSAVEDSAFIDAPRPDKELFEVEMTINSFGGIIKALENPAWTGQGNQAADFESRCENSYGRAFMKCIKNLDGLLVQAIDVRSEEEDAEAAYEMTTDYLRNRGADVEKHIAGIAEMVNRMCSEGLAPKENLTTREVTARESLLRDLSQRLIPASILIIEQACDIGPSEAKRGQIHLILNSFTLQFLLRSVGWTKRLLEALTRGLENWPIDNEFTKNEEDLNEDEVKLKYAKKKSREDVQKKIMALSAITKEAARALSDQATQAAKKKHEERLRLKGMIRQQKLWEAREQKQAQEAQQSAQRWAAFCASTQALRSAPDPMKQKWDRAKEAASQQYEALQTSVFSTSVRSSAYAHKKTGVAVSQGARIDDDEDPFADDEDPFADDEDPFAIDEDHNDRPAFIPGWNRLASENGISGSGLGGRPARPTRAGEAWDGSDWTEAEEKTLLRSIRYDKDYNPSSLAWKLNRLESDVARKAALFKSTYRKIYTERGADIPAWAL